MSFHHDPVKLLMKVWQGEWLVLTWSDVMTREQAETEMLKFAFGAKYQDQTVAWALIMPQPAP